MMNVLELFKRYILDNHIVVQSDKLLLAVSGGKDSMLMAWLFVKLGYAVEIAHCNFQLRGEESDRDEQLVRDFALANNVICHVNSFDTIGYAAQHKVSIQMAARDLRYAWFEELRIQKDLDYIAVAQHKNDNVETVLFNLSRGTGLKGLTGIQLKRARIIRPLLFLRSKDIAQIVADNSIPYRDDSSNFSNKYARNKIRLDIIPEFEKLNPDFIEIMEDNICRFQESIDVLDSFVSKLRTEILVSKGSETWVIEKSSISGKKLGLLYLLFEPFQFSKSVLEDVLLSLNNESGRIFESEEYVLISDRSTLVLKKKAENSTAYFIEQLIDQRFQWGNVSFELSHSDDCSIVAETKIVKIDIDKIVLPLTIRVWEEGDAFCPLGMKGKKKISDLFIQRKINVLEKREVPILVNGNGEIIWVAGIQLDDRYKITQNTKKVLKLVIQKI